MSSVASDVEGSFPPPDRLSDPADDTGSDPQASPKIDKAKKKNKTKLLGKLSHKVRSDSTGDEADFQAGLSAKTPKKHTEKTGHRRVDLDTGETSYKKVKSNELMSAIQMGLRQSIGAIQQRKECDLLLRDFDEVESLYYPREGTSATPPHRFSNFKFYSYAPLAFRHFRKAFGIDTSDFLMSLCDGPLRELENAGASGSIFYKSHDDMFIIKTIQKGEHNFLRKLLPGYYMNLVQNKRTLLPKFFGHFCYQTALGKNIRFIVMNNLLPSNLTYYETYDLKGSTHGRKASEYELSKKKPTLKDMDFRDRHNIGIRLTPETYNKLVNTMRRDCLVLESFKIMDYSLLVGVHNTVRDTNSRVDKQHDSGQDGGEREAASAPPRVLVVSGRVGAHASLLNGEYIRLSPIGSDTRYSFKKHEGEERGVLIFYDPKHEYWCMVRESAKDKMIAYLPWAGESPVAATGVWSVVDETGKYVQDEKLTLAAKDARDAVDERLKPPAFSSLSEAIESDEDDRRPSTPEPVLAGVAAGTAGSASGASERNLQGGVVCYNEQNEKCFLFLGIIDVLQSYVVKKKLEHTWKALIYDGDTVSVHKPGFYSNRFLQFMSERVFQPLKTPTAGASGPPPASSARLGRTQTANSNTLSTNGSSFRRHRLSSVSPERSLPGSPRYSRRRLAMQDGHKSEDSDAEGGRMGPPSPSVDVARIPSGTSHQVITVHPVAQAMDDSAIADEDTPRATWRNKEEIRLVVTSPSTQDLLHFPANDSDASRSPTPTTPRTPAPYQQGDAGATVSAAAAAVAAADIVVELRGDDDDGKAAGPAEPEDDMSFV